MKFARSIGLAAVIALTASTSLRAETPGRNVASITQPEALGFDSSGLDRLDSLFQAKVDRGEMAGIVILVARHGKIAHFSAIGYANTKTHQRMQRDSIFRLYSMTKPIAATALMILYEEGKFRLDDPISKYIPEFKGIRVLRTPDSPISDTVPAIREPTIHDLFRHTAGLEHGLGFNNAVDKAYVSAGITDPNVPLEEMAKRLSKIPLRFQPGTKFNYSLGQDIQARLVEILSGKKFDVFLKERLFDPLGMKDTGWWVSRDNAPRLVAIHWMKHGKIVPMDDLTPYPNSPYIFTHPSDIKSYFGPHARLGGSYGLVSTAEDYWHFAQMMLNGGELYGHRILGPSTVEFMSRDHSGSTLSVNDKGVPTGMGWGLGFALVKDAAAAGSMVPDGSYYWSGAANTSFWIDPKNDIVVVEMTQSIDLHDDKLEPNEALREKIAAIVYGALTAH